MQRRAFLASIGTTTLAGCSSDNTPSTPTPRTETQTTTPGESGSSDFKLLGIRSPETQRLNTPTGFTIVVKNIGPQKKTFRSVLETKQGDGEWTETGEITMTLPAGKTGEWRSPRFIPQYLTTLYFRLVAFDKKWSIKIKPKLLDFSNYYKVPTGLYLNVLGGSFEPVYPTATNSTATNETTEPTPTPTTPVGDNIWAVMRLQVRNSLKKPLTTPKASEFVLEVNGERRPQHQEVSDDPYRSSELAARTITRGDLVYSVPAGTHARDLKLWWKKSLPKGVVKAIWTK